MMQMNNDNIDDDNISTNTIKIIKLWQLNCNCLNQTKLVEFKQCILNEKPSLMCIQETWWSSKTKVKIPGYDIIRIDRTSKGGGVAIFVNLDIFQVIETIDISDSLRNVEALIVKSLRKDGKHYSFANIYNNKGSNAI